VSSVILFGVVLVTALFFRRSFCGYICPLGALQEFFGKLRGLLFGKRRFEMPASIDRPARFLKYAVLAFFTVWTWQAATLAIRPDDPWVAYMHLTSGELFTEMGIGLGILVVSLVGSVVYDRFFCKYLCPMGAFLGIVSKVSLFKVRRNADSCISCGACDKACPVNLTVSAMETVTSAECINCNECVNSCPVAHTLEVADAPYGRKRTSLVPTAVLGFTVLIIALFVGWTTVSGAFAWTMPTLSQAIEQNGGEFNPEDIKGRMSFAEIASATGIAPAVFEQQFGIQPAEMTVPIKDLAPVYGFDVHTDVREFVVATLAAMPTQSTQGAPGAGSEEAAGGD
jgi:ferredoxin